MLAVISLMTGALVLTAFDNLFPSFFSIIMAPGVLTDKIDFSSWSCHVFARRIVLLQVIINYNI